MSAYDFYLEQQQRRREALRGRQAGALTQRAAHERHTATRAIISDDEGLLDADALDGYEDDRRWSPRPPTSVRRYAPAALPTRASSTHHAPPETALVPARRERPVPAVTTTRRAPPREAVEEDDAPLPRARRLRWSGLVYLVVGLLALSAGWLLLNDVGWWWQTTQNDWTYGRPRTFQIDAVVGHHDSAANPSHFITVNLNQRLIIIEFPGGDPAHAAVYSGPLLVGPGEDLAPVTLSFRDVTGNGKLDMIATIDGTAIVFINDNGGFRPPRPGEVKPSSSWSAGQ
ncbi:MAG TPA: hypothetical protein VGS80_03370 [Ktedonobacterales bacterium]|nr:hypothetical protein [Ktedonobacterales bacterium]